MIRRDEWKLACYHGPGAATDMQLFNLKEDPDETVRQLRSRLFADWETGAEDPGCRATIVRGLRSEFRLCRRSA